MEAVGAGTAKAESLEEVFAALDRRFPREAGKSSRKLKTELNDA